MRPTINTRVSLHDLDGETSSTRQPTEACHERRLSHRSLRSRLLCAHACRLRRRGRRWRWRWRWHATDRHGGRSGRRHGRRPERRQGRDSARRAGHRHHDRHRAGLGRRSGAAHRPATTSTAMAWRASAHDARRASRLLRGRAGADALCMRDVLAPHRSNGTGVVGTTNTNGVAASCN